MSGGRGSAKAARGRASSAVLALGLGVALVAGLAGCTSDPLAEQYRNGGDKGFIAGEFGVIEYPADQRGEPIAFEGVTETGDTVTNADYAGDVLVVNFWFANCGPCRAEAPLLEEVHAKYAAEGAQFLGVNTYDQAATAASFAKDFGVTYPSVIDINDKKVALAFASATPLSSTPVTLVLDRQGRVAARIIGQVTDTSILGTLVRDALAETS